MFLTFVLNKFFITVRMILSDTNYRNYFIGSLTVKMSKRISGEFSNISNNLGIRSESNQYIDISIILTTSAYNFVIFSSIIIPLPVVSFFN